jgi:DNA-binding beta-propeller fold protein YncE
MDEPVGIAFDPLGDIYVADTWNRRVQVFTSSGVFLRQWPIDGWDAKDNAGKASLIHEDKPYIAIDANGYVYVTDPTNYRVLVFDRFGNYMLSFGKYGTDNASFTLPVGIAAAEDGTIYVSDAHNNRILVFDPLDLIKTDAMQNLPPSLTYPAAGEKVYVGKIPLLGKGIPGSELQVLIDDTLVGTTTIGIDGFWFLTVELSEPGAHSIKLHATTADGLEFSFGPANLIVSVRQ